MLKLIHFGERHLRRLTGGKPKRRARQPQFTDGFGNTCYSCASCAHVVGVGTDIDGWLTVSLCALWKSVAKQGAAFGDDVMYTTARCPEYTKQEGEQA